MGIPRGARVLSGQMPTVVVDGSGTPIGFFDLGGFSPLPLSIQAPGPVTRTALGTAADQVDAELVRITVPASRVGDTEMLKITLAAVKRNAITSNVNVSFGVGIGPIGVTYGSSTKIFPSDDTTSLQAVPTVGQSRASYQEYLMVGLGASSQDTVNSRIPVAVVGPSLNSLTPSALDLSEGFDIVVAGKFAASAPVGDNFTILGFAVRTA